MASSSRSRSCSNKRSPDRGNPRRDNEEEPEAGTAAPAGGAVATEGETAAPEGGEAARDRAAPEGGEAATEGATPAPKGEGPAGRAAQSKARTTGAVQHRRKKGTPGTWTCDHCQRTISDNPCSKKQHLDSVYCRACRLYNEGYADGDWEACRQKAERVLWAEPWPQGGDERPRGSQPPPEPKHPPRQERHDDGSCRRQDRKRSRSRARSSGRERRPHAEGRRNRSRSRDRRRQSRTDSRGNPDPPEFVKVVVEKYEPRYKTERHEGLPEPPQKAPQKPPPTRQAVKQEQKSGKLKEGNQQQQRGKTTAAAEDGPMSSSDYTYEYESSTPDGGDAEGKAAAAPEAAGSAGDKPTSALVRAAAQKAVPPHKAEGKAPGKAAASADAAGQHKDMMVPLLKTAMETVGKSFQ